MSRTDIEINITRSLVLKSVIGFCLFLALIFVLNSQSDKRLTKQFSETYAYYSQYPDLDSIKLFLDTMQYFNEDNYKKLSDWIPPNRDKNYHSTELWLKRTDKYYNFQYGVINQDYRYRIRPFNKLPQNLEMDISSPNIYKLKLKEYLDNGYGDVIIMIDSTEENTVFLKTQVDRN